MVFLFLQSTNMNILGKSVKNAGIRGLKSRFQNETFIKTNSSHRKIMKCYGFGVTASGALGIKDNIIPGRNAKLINKISVSLPIRIKYFHENQLDIIKVSCGYGFSLFLSSKGSEKYIHGTGINSDGQLGSHDQTIFNSEIDVSIIPFPCKINFDKYVSPKKYKLTNADIGAGRAHSIISCTFQNRENPEEKLNQVFSLGNNSFGQCGRRIISGEIFSSENAIIHKVDLPQEIFPIKKVVCGQDHSLLLNEAGHVYSCGMGSDGQTGLDTFENIDTFTRVLGSIENVKIKDLSSKGDTVLAFSECNKIFIWGNNEYSQIYSKEFRSNTSAMKIGEFQPPPQSLIQFASPLELDFSSKSLIIPKEAGADSPADLEIGQITSVACTGSMCAVLDSYGKVFVWGFGFPGLGPNVNFIPKPTLIPPGLFSPAFAHASGAKAKNHLTNLVAGLHHFVAYSTHLGQAFSWGTSRSGIACLGLGNDSFSEAKAQTYPEKIIIPASVQYVDCGVDHTIVLARSFD